ncbi:MAG: histidinol dehydrogenase [Eubacteriales bacterium]|nr:histidinol dehydrogenase [Eubacteriales bacterium]
MVDQKSNTVQIPIIRTERAELSAITTKLGLRHKMDLAPVIETVQSVIDAIRNRGDAAVLELTQRFDKANLTADQLRVQPHEIAAATASLDLDFLQTLKAAAANISTFHKAQLTPDLRLPTAYGGYTGLIQRPLDIVGVYVPGGSAPLPSSVLMNVLPAKAAGVPKIVMCTPPRADGTVHPAILAAADIAGVDEIYRIGGAQAIAAMAYGTSSVPAVDKICGPGNIYVNTAKRLVYGHCDIDMFAGPSEILILADESANPTYVAADMLSQAEHDPLASSILVTTSEVLATAVAKELQRRVPLLPRHAIIERSLHDYGAILLVPDLATAIDFVNELAPEHLELCLKDADLDSTLASIRHAGAIFIGHYSPEPLGDYFAGPNHVLPTSGTARFFSPLNTADFIKKTSLIHYTREDLAAVWEKVAHFADQEDLAAHADALRVRFGADLAATTEPSTPKEAL